MGVLRRPPEDMDLWLPEFNSPIARSALPTEERAVRAPGGLGESSTSSVPWKGDSGKSAPVTKVPKNVAGCRGKHLEEAFELNEEQSLILFERLNFCPHVLAMPPLIIPQIRLAPGHLCLRGNPRQDLTLHNLGSKCTSATGDAPRVNPH